MRRRLTSVLVAGAAVAAGTYAVLFAGAVAEAFQAAGPGVPLWRAFAATAAACALAGVPLSIAGCLTVPWAYYLLTSRTDPNTLDTRRTAFACALCLSPWSLLAIARGLDGVLSGEGIKRIATACAAPLAMLIAFGASSAAGRALGRWRRLSEGTRRHPEAVFVALAIALVGATTGLLFTNAEVQSALSPLSYWMALAALPSSAVGYLYLRRRRRALFVACAPAAVLAAAAAVHPFAPGSPDLSQAIQERAPFTMRVRSVYAPLFTAPPPAVSPDAVASCGGALSQPGTLGRADTSAPDIVLITVDALRCDHTALCGYDRDTTPALKRWAAEGAVFTQAVSPSSTTRQSFGPIMSGIPRSVIPLPHQTTNWGASIGRNQPTIAEHLAAAGYETILVNSVPWAFPRKFNLLKGFEVVDNTASSDKALAKKKGMAALQIDTALTFLGGNRARPRFVFVHLMETHEPYPSAKGGHNWGKRPIDRYDEAAAFADSQIGRLLNAVMDRENGQDTYVVISADHGEAFEEHGRRHHGHSVYQEEVHVPLLVLGPGIPARRIDAPVSLMDLAPTITELAGLAPVSGVFGGSLVPAMRGGADPPDNAIAELELDHKNGQYRYRAYYRGRHKLVVNLMTGKDQLFDIIEDPREVKDLSAKNPDLVRAMVAKANALLGTCRR